MEEALSSGHAPTTAAMFLYLQHTGFNGLWRVNSKGEMNVAPGTAEPLDNFDHLWRAHGLLRTHSCALQVTRHHFSATLADAAAVSRDRVVVYCDPPYVGAHVEYTDGWQEWRPNGTAHTLLERLGRELWVKGVPCIISNSVEARNLYRGWERRQVSGMRTGSRTSKARKMTPELLMVGLKDA